MNQYQSLIAITLTAAALTLVGCASPQSTAKSGNPATTQPAPKTSPELTIGYARIHRIADRNASVKDVLIIKRPSKTTADLLRTISKTCRDVEKTLEAFADADPSLDLKTQHFPEIEVAARDAIEKTTTSDIIGSRSITFERSILITQLEALRYLRHISKVVAEEETDPDRKAKMEKITEQFKSLRAAVYTQLASLPPDAK